MYHNRLRAAFSMFYMYASDKASKGLCVWIIVSNKNDGSATPSKRLADTTPRRITCFRITLETHNRTTGHVYEPIIRPKITDVAEKPITFSQKKVLGIC